MASWKVDNAENRGPNFIIPSREDRDNLAKGDFVKLVFVGPRSETSDKSAGERMWVRVTGVEPGGRYKGTLASDPAIMDFADLKYDSPVEFGPESVCDIYTRG